MLLAVNATGGRMLIPDAFRAQFVALGWRFTAAPPGAPEVTTPTPYPGQPAPAQADPPERKSALERKRRKKE